MTAEIQPVNVRRREYGSAVQFTGDNREQVVAWVMGQLTGPEMILPWMIGEPLVHPGEWVVIYHPDEPKSVGVGIRFLNEENYRAMFEEIITD